MSLRSFCCLDSVLFSQLFWPVFGREKREQIQRVPLELAVGNTVYFLFVLACACVSSCVAMSAQPATVDQLGLGADEDLKQTYTRSSQMSEMRIEFGRKYIGKLFSAAYDDSKYVKWFLSHKIDNPKQNLFFHYVSLRRKEREMDMAATSQLNGGLDLEEPEEPWEEIPAAIPSTPGHVTSDGNTLEKELMARRQDWFTQRILGELVALRTRLDRFIQMSIRAGFRD